MFSVFKLVKNPAKIVFIFDRLNVSKLIPDKAYLKLKFKACIGQSLNLDSPKTYNEKLQWLKLYDHKPEYTNMVDKYEVKNYVAQRIGEEYIIPTLGVWDKVEDIDFDSLPNQFVLKCTHDSGGLVICRDKAKLDIDQAKKKLNEALHKNFYFIGREWPYKNVKPRIIAEKYMEDKHHFDLVDYKILCFNGVPKLIQIHNGRFNLHTQDFYDFDWNKLDIKQGPPVSDTVIEKPAFIEDMYALTLKLANISPHVRIDWYYVDGKMYFGEITFFDGSGFNKFEPEEWDEKIGAWIKLPNKLI